MYVYDIMFMSKVQRTSELPLLQKESVSIDTLPGEK